MLLNAAPARPLSEALAKQIDVLVVNAVEAEMFAKAAVTDLATAALAALHLSKRFATVIVTAGAKGLAWTSEGQPPVLLPAVKVKAVSSHGAGDCFTGVLAQEHGQGKPLSTACATAAQAAAAHVAKL